jgi:hypothetical protein
MDFQLACAPVSDPDAIRRREPSLSGGKPLGQRALEDWLSSAIWRHCRNVTDVRFHYELLTNGAVPGSYSIEVVATVHGGQGASAVLAVPVPSIRRWTRSLPAWPGWAGTRLRSIPIAYPNGGGHATMIFRKRAMP